MINCDTFNDYFVNIISELGLGISNKNVPDAIDLLDNYILSKRGCDSFKWQIITEVDILKYVSQLSSSKSEDYYGLSNKVIKEIIDIIIVPLTHIFNQILKQGVYPKAFKITKVVPIYKKGDRLSPSSYRPISLVPVISKILESCIKQQLNRFFEQNNLFCDEQFGFISGRNTVKAVEQVVKNILFSFESKITSSATLIDLTKAFDCISHNILLKKLFKYGVKNNELCLLESYLSERMQMVVQEQEKSSFKLINNGVPQGSVLGPFLFVIAINDLSFNVPCSTVLYADDTTLINFDKNLDNLFKIENQAFNAALTWFQSNNLLVNNSKTEKLIFSLNHDVYKDTRPVKLLGLYLDSRLSWDHHVEELCKKLSRVVFLLRKLRYYVSRDMLITAYHAFFQSNLRYGITLWGNSCSAHKAFLWQKKALRTIKNVSDWESCVPIFKELNIMTLPSLYIFCSLIKVKENLSNFKIRQDTHSHATRKNYCLELFPVKLEKSNRNFPVMEIKLFNKLPKEAWSVPLKKFKDIAEKWFIQKTFYSVDEFLVCDISSLVF